MYSRRQEKTTTFLAFFTWGVVMICRTAFGYYLTPLHLSPSQAGLANFMTSIVVCIAAVPLTRLADRKQSYARLLTAELLVCALSMLLLSAAKSFPTVLAAKALLGLGCAPIFTMLMTLTERVSTPETYPGNAGIISNGESILNTIAGPTLIVFLLGSVGFGGTNRTLAAALLFMTVLWIFAGRGLRFTENKKEDKASPLIDIIRAPNILICLFGTVSALITCWCIYLYVPTLLTQNGEFSDRTMSTIMTLMGVFMTVWLIVLPRLSNRTGRKKLVIVFSFVAAATIFVLSFLQRSGLFRVAVFVLFGGCCSAVCLFFAALIPVASVKAADCAAAVALIDAAGEFLGSSVGPLIVGFIADAAGIRTGMAVSGIAMVACGVLGLFLKEER